jgi:hypothetical protein
VDTIMDKDHLLVCPKLELYWDARRLWNKSKICH